MVIVPITPMERMGFNTTSPVSAQGSGGVSLPFDSVLKDAIQNLNQTQAVAAQDNINLALGNVDDLTQIQINSLKAEAMVNTTVQLTTRLVNAYKEIVQMQV